MDVLDVLNLLYSLDVLDLLRVLDVLPRHYPPGLLHLFHSHHHTTTGAAFGGANNTIGWALRARPLVLLILLFVMR